jgi:hypothetical protein
MLPEALGCSTSLSMSYLLLRIVPKVFGLFHAEEPNAKCMLNAKFSALKQQDL